MKNSGIKILTIIFTLFFLFGCAAQGPVQPLPDFAPQNIAADQYSPAVDNFLVILDASSSMDEKYNSNKKFIIAKEIVSRMNQTLPEMGQICGLRSYGHHQTVSKKSTLLFLGMDEYSTAGYTNALDKISVPGGTSPLYKALAAASHDLEKLKGKTALIIISDGKDMTPSTAASAQNLIDKYGSSLCIYPILVGDDAQGADLMKKIADIGLCGFNSSADQLLTGSAMADFVKQVFLTKKRIKKAVPQPVKKDSDNDGVYDEMDKCPGTPQGVSVDSNGCPFDSDKDGVYDYKDKCPDTPMGAHVNSHGCWILGKTLFDFDKSEIKSAWFSELNKIAEILKKNPSLNIVIEGHTDNIGTKKYNMKLSMRRAKAVQRYLVSNGVAKQRMSCEAFDFSQPFASNETESGRAMNRRVEFTPVK